MGRGDDTSQDLEAFAIEAMGAWKRLQDGVWGPRWDGLRASLDFTRESLFTLSSWLDLAANEHPILRLEEILRDAGQYLGEVIQEHFIASWDQLPTKTIGLRILLVNGGYRNLDMLSLATMWRATIQQNDGYKGSVFVRHFDEATENARPTHS